MVVVVEMLHGPMLIIQLKHLCDLDDPSSPILSYHIVPCHKINATSIITITVDGVNHMFMLHHHPHTDKLTDSTVVMIRHQ
jgi:hypothetical protein